jgi:DNA-binding PadR family transcriptional regulator
MFTLSQQEEVILEMLMSGQELYGLEMIQKSEGKLKLGSIYVYLAKLEKNQLVSSKLEPLREGEYGKPRRLYQITSSGKAIYHRWQTYKQDIVSLLPNPIARICAYFVAEFS